MWPRPARGLADDYPLYLTTHSARGHIKAKLRIDKDTLVLLCYENIPMHILEKLNITYGRGQNWTLKNERRWPRPKLKLM